MTGNAGSSTIHPFNFINNSGNPVLIDFIRGAIRQTGPVTFEWFMEQALYHPEQGYYSSGRCALGRRGDYFTNVTVGPLFGRLLAAQFAEMWENMGRPDDFVIVEQGAHHGEFARDLLKASQERTPEFFAILRYWIVEPFSIMRMRQQITLGEFAEKLKWEASLIDLDPFCGVHFSNELVDSMPVRLVRRPPERGSWEERCVVEAGDGFDFISAPITDADLRAHLGAIPQHPGPYETEVSLPALKWIETLARKLTRGYVVIIDYGYPREIYYSPARTSGTLQCRAHHRVVESPLTNIGEIDITAHVDWTALAERAQRHGLTVAGFTDQHHFITGIAAALMREEFESIADPSSRRALQTLLHPELLGTIFQVLALTKDVISSGSLSGFKFARDPLKALGL